MPSAAAAGNAVPAPNRRDELLAIAATLFAERGFRNTTVRDIDDASYLGGFERFGYLAERNEQFERLWRGVLHEGVDSGELRQDLDVDLVYRFVRDTVWVAVTWYRPGGALSADQVADQSLSILLGGIARG